MKSIFEIAKSGLRSSKQSMSVTSNNIVNAGTDGYSRQRIAKSPDGMQMGSSHVGLGVDIVDVNRLRDEMNDTQLNQKQHEMGFLDRKADVFEKLEANLISDDSADLDGQITGLFDNFSDLASNPQDVSVRDDLVREAQQFTSKMQRISQNIDQTSNQVRDFAGKTVDSINGLLSDISELNQSIKQAQAKGEPNHTSLDKRVAKMDELSKLVNFESRVTDNGAMTIQIDGKNVVDENQSYALKSEADDINKKYRLRLESGHVVKPTGGKIGAEIKMFEEDIPDLKSKIDNIASTVVEEFNNIHSNGYGLEDNTQRDFFNPAGTTAQDIEMNPVLASNSKHIAASSVAGEAGNGENASQIAAIRNQNVIGNVTDNQKLTDYTVGVISEPGVELSSVNSSLDARNSEIEMLKNQQEQTAGVNIDEELSRMVNFQRSYQGAAKVMSTGQQMYDTLIGIVR